jgi:hypothetical protein
MIRKSLRVFVGAALVGALTAPAITSAKPPDLPEDGTFTAKPIMSKPSPEVEVLPIPSKEYDITCPYLRQQMVNRHAHPITGPEMGREVLDNLERLKESDDLLELAKHLAHVGSLALAKECCQRAAELCPGSPCANRAAVIMQELERGVDMPATGSNEASEPPMCPYCGKTGKPIRQIVPGKKKADAEDLTSSAVDYVFEIGVNDKHGLRLNANCSVSSSVYHLSYKDGCLTIWKTPDAGKTKP